MTGSSDDRGVSEVMGAVMVFAIVVTLLGILQTMAVPQQNADVEFKHSQQVADEMVDLRAAALESARTGETTTATVTLGTDYPSRFVLLNPGPASGTLRTTGVGGVDASAFEPKDVCGTDEAVDSRSLVYEPTYNVYDSAPTTVYEHGFTYRKYDDGVQVDNEQSLFRDGTITLLPLVGEYSASGTEKTSVDLASTGMGRTTFTTSDPFTVTVPSQLSAERWSEQENLLEDEIASGPIEKVTSPDSTHIKVHFAPEEETVFTVACAVLGTGVALEANPPSSDGGSQINPPPSTGDLVLQGATSQRSGEVEMGFKNHGEAKSVTETRVNFFYASKPGASNPPDTAKIVAPGSSDLMTIGGEFQEVSPSVSYTAGEEKSITVTFYKDDSGSRVYDPGNTVNLYALTVRFDDGTTSTYFVQYST